MKFSILVIFLTLGIVKADTLVYDKENDRCIERGTMDVSRFLKDASKLILKVPDTLFSNIPLSHLTVKEGKLVLRSELERNNIESEKRMRRDASRIVTLMNEVNVINQLLSDDQIDAGFKLFMNLRKSELMKEIEGIKSTYK